MPEIGTFIYAKKCTVTLDLALLTGHDARAPYTRHVDKPRGQKSDHATKSRKNVRY